MTGGEGVKKASLLSIFLLVSCQLFTDSDVVQCKTDKDCQSRGGAFAGSVCRDQVCAGPTACRDHVSWEAEDPSRPLHTHVLFVDFSQKPVVGAKAVVCAQLDPNCDHPSAPFVTGPDGYALIEIPRAFRGQILVKEPPPGFDETYLPTALITYPPVVVDETVNTPVPSYAAVRLLTRSQLDLLLGLLGKKTEPGKAVILGAVYDCNYQPLREVSINATPDDPNRLFFLGDDSDVLTNTRKTTAGSAIFAYLNVTPGIVEVEATYQNQRWSKLQVVTRPDVITTFEMPPSPPSP